MKEGFKHIQEILMEVAEEEGMSKRQINDLWNHHKAYTVSQMKDDNVYAIHIPFIGTLSLNTKQHRIEKQGKNYTFYKKFHDKVNNLLKHKDFKKYGNSHKKTPSIHKLLSYIFKTYEVDLEEKKVRITPSLVWEVLSKYSNNKYNKKE